MKQTFKLTILFGCIYLCLYANLFAFEDSEKLLYLTEDFRPYNYLDNGELKGFSIDLLKMIWRELDIEYQEIHVYPWARAYLMLQTHKNTVLFSTAKTKERSEMFKWVGPIAISTRTVLISLKSNHLKIKSIEEAKKYKIGTIRNDAAEQILISIGFSDKQFAPVSKPIQNIKKMDAGRIDLIAFDERSFYKFLETSRINSDKYETIYVANETQACYAFSKDVPDALVYKFQNALDKIKQRPEYQKLLVTYFEENHMNQPP